MTVQEFDRRWVIIDGSLVLEISDNNRVHYLDDKTAKLVRRILGLDKEPVAVPSRNVELANPPDPNGDDKPVTGIALQLLSLLAEHKDPISAAQILQSGSFNEGTMSSRLSVLKSRGYISAVGTPFQYMLTGKGHAALIDSSKTAP